MSGVSFYERRLRSSHTECKMLTFLWPEESGTAAWHRRGSGRPRAGRRPCPQCLQSRSGPGGTPGRPLWRGSQAPLSWDVWGASPMSLTEGLVGSVRKVRLSFTPSTWPSLPQGHRVHTCCPAGQPCHLCSCRVEQTGPPLLLPRHQVEPL